MANITSKSDDTDTGARFDKLDNRIDRFEKRFEKFEKHVDRKFEEFEKRVDGKFEEFEKRVDGKIEKAVTELSLVISDFSNQVANEFIKTNKRIDKIQRDVDFIINQIDAITKKQEIDDDERLVMGAHLDRMDKWIHELADKIGYKLTV